MQFKDIAGYDEIKDKLIRTVKNNRVSHAQLFIGPEGNAKLALAIAYAQYINCENRTDDSCGVCHSCIKYSKLIHPDLHFVYPVVSTEKIKKPLSRDFLDKWRELLISNDYFVNLDMWYEALDVENKQGIINSDDCNGIIKTLSYTSYESEYKVMIIWMVDKLYYAAAPRILKILEEPPDKTLFILISENQSQIINTILSRTQIVKVPGLNEQELLEQLLVKTGADRVKVKKMARYANGNYIEALRFLNDEEKEEELLLFRDWMRACYRFDGVELMAVCDRLASFGREGLKSFLQHCTEFIDDFLKLRYKLISTEKFESEEKQFMESFAAFVHAGNIHHFYDEFNDAIYHIERNALSNIVVMDLSVKVSRLLKLKQETNV